MSTNGPGLGCGALLARACVPKVTHTRLETEVEFMAGGVQEPDGCGDGYVRRDVEEDAVEYVVEFRLG